MKKPKITVAFDLGKASLGICARTETELLALKALEIPPEFAAIADFRTRRRMWRTRQAHKARETFFMDKLWIKAGLPDYRQPDAWEALKTRPGFPACYANDKKLWTREFPAKADAHNTVFNSALLRIQLIEGERLEDWQIWRALWSAIQKRGHHFYDWKTVPKELLTEDLNEGIDLAIDTMQAQVSQFERQIEALKAEEKTVGKLRQLEIKEEIKALKAQEKEWKDANKDFLDDLEKLQGFKQVIGDQVQDMRFAYPCNLEARRMKLWKPVYNQQTGQFDSVIASPRLGVEPEPLKAEEQKMPRAFRMKELKALWQQAIKQLPQLSALGKSANYFLFGETEQPYATVGWDKSRPDRFKVMRVRGRAELDWQGVLGQKVPRFDNRIIAKCQLFPTRNVCKASDELNIRFSLLTQLKNLRLLDGSRDPRSFTPAELSNMLAYCLNVLNSNSEVSFTNLGKAAKEAVPGFTGFVNLANREKIRARTEGRARFCKPALRLLCGWLLNLEATLESSPLSFDYGSLGLVQEGKLDKNGRPIQNPVTHDEIRLALGRMGSTWDRFMVGDDRDQAKEKAEALILDCTDPATGEVDQARLAQKRHAAVLKLVGSSNNPIVRNRLMIFYRELVKLDQWLRDAHSLDIASQGQVIIEFVRGADSGFDGKKSAEQFNRAIKENQANNEEQAENLRNAGLAVNRKSLERMKLWKEQGGICVYTGEKIIESDLGTKYDIDHIVPQSERYYSDAMWNKVVTRIEVNQGRKKAQTPHQWLSGDSVEWAQYVERVKAIYGNSDRKSIKRKLALLTSPDAVELLETYNGLAETSYIARLAQQIVALHFAWGLQTEKTDADSGRKMFVNDGATTARIRKVYKLERLLLTTEEALKLEQLRVELAQARMVDSDEGRQRVKDLLKAIEPLNKKKRSNPRHHALDAFCISFSQSVKRQKLETGRWVEYIPELEHTGLRAQMEAQLATLFVPTIRRNTKETYPEETLYRYSPKHGAVLIRRSLASLLEKKAKAEDLEKIIAKILDLHIRADLLGKVRRGEFVTGKNYPHPKWGNVVQKVLCVASEARDGVTVGPDGQPLAVTEYRDYGHGDTRGQFKKTKQHKGQLLYKDKKGKWKVYPIYGYMSVKAALDDITAKGWEVYHDPGTGEPLLFYSSAPIALAKSVKGGQVPAGEYKLRTIKSGGTVILEDNQGEEIGVSVRDLAEGGATLSQS